MDDDKTVKLHDIFNVDPIELQSFIGRYVDVNLVNEVNLSGIVYTIDPVSQSIILIGDASESVKMNIIMKHAVRSMKVIPETPLHLKSLNIENLFGYKSNVSASEVGAAKERVKSWLLKNMIEVEEIGDLLKLESLEIHPPYSVDNCICSNSIVLDRVQQLLRNMPHEAE